jgi:hypothetical protein
MATYTFTGWRQVVVEQSFDIEADSQEEANQKIWKLQNEYELENQWFDYTTNSIKGDANIDFYDEDDNLVEEAV